MPPGIGAGGFVGIALEVTPGTYVAPDKFFPIRNETLSWEQGTVWRRVIRGTADAIGAVEGNGSVGGDIDMELLDDVLPYFLQIARGDMTQSAAPAPFTYEFVPNHEAVPNATASITVVRNGVSFGYVGCVVSSMNFGTDEGMATVTFSILGTAENEENVPTPTYNPDDKPFGAGTWVIEIPTATQIFDADNFSFQVEDNGEVQFRLKDILGAQFVSYGERSVTVSMDRDFLDRDEYDAFKLLTSKGISVNVSRGADRSVTLVTPAAIIDTYESNLSGQGDLIRASISYQGVHDAATGGGYTIEVVTNEDLDLN
jgi:hypothetical protein